MKSAKAPTVKSTAKKEAEPKSQEPKQELDTEMKKKKLFESMRKL